MSHCASNSLREQVMICLPPQGTPPPQHSSRHGPQHTQHTVSTAATPRYPRGRRRPPADAPTPLKEYHGREHRSRGAERHAAYVAGNRNGRPSEARRRHKAPTTGGEASRGDPHRNTHRQLRALGASKHAGSGRATLHDDPRRYLCNSPPVASATRRRARQTAPG